MKNNFLEFLNNKTMYYDKIDYSIIEKSWNIISSHIKLPYVIHIVGTNGKGSTGRYIASFLYQLNKTVLHYSSPHVLEFNERIWINNKNSTDKQLQKAHEQLQEILSNEYLNKLTYFEYTTLIGLVLSSGLGYIVLEAGLGGEFDATNVVKNNLSVIPSIGLDHIEFLGNTIELIATTKLKSCDESFILGLNMPIEVQAVKNKILKNKKEILVNKNLKLPKDTNTLPIYLKNNLILAVSVLDYLSYSCEDLEIPELFARCQKVENNITIDVGHNLLAANVIYEEFKTKNIIVIYNSYKDKDYMSVLKKLKPIIKQLQIIKINDDRILKKEFLCNICKELNIPCEIYNNKIEKDNEYLVFGSFKVVEEFLKLRINYKK